MPSSFSCRFALIALSLVVALPGFARLQAAPRPATGDESAMLEAVLHATANDLRRWAYTEHRVVRDEKGRMKSDQLVRYDPSKPHAEQWMPLAIDGREPTERERAKFRRRGEQDGAGETGRHGPARRSLGELIDVARAFVVEETPSALVFEIPLLKVGNERFPPEKFQVLARIRKEVPGLENIAVKLRESFRSKLVLKVKSGGGSLDFARVDPKHPPTVVAVNGDASASLLFVSVGGSLELTRTELRHVRPFDERFEVQIGTLKAIDF